MKTEMRSFRLGLVVSSLLILGVLTAPVHAQYTVHSVEMPDGILLDTYVWEPTTGGPTFPTVLMRSSYNPLNPPDVNIMLFVQEGYVVVSQRIRGTGASQGVFFFNRDDPSDGHATIEWIAQQSWSNGKVGMIGRSGMGTTQYAVAEGAPSALKCLAPAHSTPDRYHMVFPGGALFYDLAYNWSNSHGFMNVYYELLEHRLWSVWWEDFDWIDAPGTINVPIFHMGRWYDWDQSGALLAFQTIQHQGGVNAAGNQYLWMDPLDRFHDYGQYYPLHPPSPIPFEEFRKQLRLDWLAYWLKDEATGVDSWPAARIYVMGAWEEPGAPGNAWVEMSDWPPAAETRSFYLAEDWTLSESIPTPGQQGLIINPEFDPVRTWGGANYVEESGPWDQAAFPIVVPVPRPIESRADVLTFTTAPLTEPATVIGPVTAKIWINPNTPDLDLSVRLTDVYPDGRSMLIMDGIQRARMRCGDDMECFLPLGVPTEIEVELGPTAIAFNTGHRIRVAIAGTNWERFERNSNDGGDLNNPNYIIANPEILFGPQYPTAILLPFPALFADGFESGDTSAWSSTVP